MKKILILAAVVAMSAACSQTYEVTPVAKDGGQIAFGSWSDGLTRADDPHLTTAWVNGDTFAIYGSKKRASGDPTVVSVFTGQAVTYDGSAWDYDDHRFWDVNYTSYEFYAVSPSTFGTDPTVNSSTGVISSGAITFAGNDNDILVADKKVVNRGDTPASYFNTFGTVPLTFNHIASCVDVKIKKTATITATVAVTDVSLTNIDNAGSFAVDADYDNTHWGGTAGPKVTWTPSGRGTYDDGDGVGSVTLPDDVTEVASIAPGTATTGDDLISGLIVMPQTMRNDSNIQTLNITYTITPTGGDVTTYTVAIPLHTFDTDYDTTNDTPFVTAWEMGKHYTYYVTIDAHAIMFSASINDWTAVSGYYYLMN